MRLTSEEEERMQLARDRIREISEGTEIVFPEYSDFFMSVAADICRIFNITDRMKKKNYFNQDIEILSEDNKALFRSVLKDNYNSSYANPEYAEGRLGIYAKQFFCTSIPLSSETYLRRDHI